MTTEMLIAGEWRAAHGTLPAEDPSTGEMFGQIARGTPADIDAAVAAARAALAGEWGAATAAERGRFLVKLGALAARDAEALARAEARDVGKPLTQARADVVAFQRYCEFYAGAADKLHGDTIPYLAGHTVMTLREPHGVTGHIIPWNYPMQMVGRSVIAALAVGNACVLKPAEEASQTALMLGALAVEAGLPAGAFNIVPGLGEEAGAALAGHGGIDHVSFTGSGEVGAIVQAAAGKHAVPVTLELGGKSPQLVFVDADLARALPFLTNAGLQNAGQTCSAASRILIQRAVFDEVAGRMAEAYAALTIGTALSDPKIGPLISARQKALVEGHLARAGVAPIAVTPLPGDLPAGGNYVAPRLFAGLAVDDRLAQEEIFGPVQILLPFDDEEEAVAIANATPYGLAASIWSADFGRQLRLARRLRAGQVFLNTYGAGGGVELPFGGTGRSGHGREKGMEALLGLTRVKTIAAWHG